MCAAPPLQSLDLERLLSLLPNLGVYNLTLLTTRGVAAQRKCLPTYANARVSDLIIESIHGYQLSKETVQNLPSSLKRLELKGVDLPFMEEFVHPKLDKLTLNGYGRQRLSGMSFSGCPKLHHLVVKSPGALDSMLLPPSLRNQLKVIQLGDEDMCKFDISDAEDYLERNYTNGTISHNFKIIVNGQPAIEFDEQGNRI